MKFEFIAAALPSALACLVLPEAAFAHDPTEEGNFFRARNASVMGRTRPDFKSEGVQYGAWIFDPELTLGVDFNDNIFAAASGEESDMVWVVNPTVDVETTWSRHGVRGWAHGLNREYSDFSDESSWTTDIGLAGHVDLTRSVLFEAGYGAAELVESRATAGAASIAAKPVEYNTTNWWIGGQADLSRTRLLLRHDKSNFNFDDAALIGGGFADQDFRDRDETIITIRGDYAVSPFTSVFARYRKNERDYDLAPPTVPNNRDSDGYMIDVGADFDIGGVARGVLGVGYNEQTYDDPSQGKLDGWGLDGLVEWYPTELTTVTVRGSRHIEDAPIEASGGFTSETFAARVDHELLRNLVLSAEVERSEHDFLGIDRVDERWSASAGATWFVNRNVGVEASFTRIEQESSGAFPGQDFEQDVIGFRVVLRP